MATEFFQTLQAVAPSATAHGAGKKDWASKLPQEPLSSRTQTMINNDSSAMKNGNGCYDNLPPTGKDVRVRHEGRDRTAYRDSDGNWRDFYTGNVLRGEVEIVDGQ